MTARDPMSGRWMKVDTSNTPVDSKFDPMTGINVGFPSDVKDSPYELVAGDRNVVKSPVAPRVEDSFAVGGSPLRDRRPKMVSAEDADHTVYGRQGAVLRSAARNSGDMDPSRYLVGGDDASR